MRIPPLLLDSDVSEMLDGASKNIGTSMSISMSGNFLISFLVNISLQNLWSLIRTLQVSLYMALVEYSYPAHTTMFMGVMVEIAELDLLNGEAIYQAIFSFADTPSFSDHFNAYNYQTMNLFFNSGSLFLILLFILLQAVFSRVLEHVAARNYKVKAWRVIGIKAQNLEDISQELIRFGLEAYLEISMATILQVTAYIK